MAQETNKSTFTLTPSWKHFFRAYTLSVLAIPIAGLGLIALYYVRKKHRQIRYIISNTHITKVDAKYEHRVDLVDIETIAFKKDWLQEKLGIGNLVLHTSASQMILAGLEKPHQLKDILEKAVQSERKRQEERKKTKARESKYQPGSMEKIDYLTGLWQQGLISNEDYQKERKYFE